MADSSAEAPLQGLAGDRATIVLFGDSLTQRGWGQSGWCAAVASHFVRQADVYNRGYGGYNTRYGLYLAPYLFPLSEQPSTPTPKHLLATVWFGANDAAAVSEGCHVPMDEYEANLRAIVSRAMRASLCVVVLTPPPVHEASRLRFQRAKYGDKATGVSERSTETAGRYAAAAARVAASLGVPCLDVHGLMLAEGGGAAWPAFVGADDAEHGDGLHLSASGQRFVGDCLLRLLADAGLDPASLPTELPLGSAVDPGNFVASMLEHQRLARASSAGSRGHGRLKGPAASFAEATFPPLGWFALGVAVAVLAMRSTSARAARVLARAE